MKKVLCVLLCIALAACLLTGCSGNDKNIDLIYPFSGNINSYDPQVASTADEYLLAENCFEGLVRTDDEGNILNGCAESWDISEDGLTYTFHIKKGLKWYVYNDVKKKFSDDYSPEITAQDFVFGLRRGADSATGSPLFSLISGIVNANAIHSGYMGSDSLGVSALDNYTLQINICSPDDGFLSALSTAIAMPCNEEFFNATNGRYGLTTEYILFNGQFMLNVITENSYILKKNSEYSGVSPAKASDVTLKIVSPDEEIAPQVISGYYDAAYLRGRESVEAGKKKGVEMTPYSNTTWSFVLNSGKGILEYKNARKALSIAVSALNYDNYPYLSDAKGLIPPTCTIGGKSYTEQSSDLTYGINQDEAVKLWKTTAKTADIYSAELIVIAPDNMESVAKELIQGIQKSICAISNIDGKKTAFTLKLEVMPQSELKSAVYRGEYDIALYPFEASASSPVSFLQSFSSSNITGFDSAVFDFALSRAEAASADELASACEACEKELINSFCYAPIFYESNYYTTAKGVSGVEFHPGTGRVSFVYATREN